MLRFRFPIVIIDEDYRSENTSGLGIRALAQAIEKEGFEVLGLTSYGDSRLTGMTVWADEVRDEERAAGPVLAREIGG